MRGRRKRLIHLLVIYFAGFATAIYCLAPVPEQANAPAERTFGHSVFKSDEFAHSFNSGMHKCLDFAKDAAGRASKFVKQKLDERQKNS
ncbi:MAG: hypothetical protein ACYTEX_00090 [Planctomycetota bacterium]|jgi:hypothetical protein